MINDNWFLKLYKPGNFAIQARQQVASWLSQQLDINSNINVIKHPLGFYLFVPYQSDKVTIRLHYWSAQQELPLSLEKMHDHVWSLDSYVLVGKLTNVEVDIQVSNDGPWKISTIKKVNNHETVSISSTRYKTNNEQRTVYKSGSRYKIQPGIFHTTIVDPGEAVITLVRSEPKLNRPSRGLVPTGTHSYNDERTACGKSESYELIHQVLKLLKKEA